MFNAQPVRGSVTAAVRNDNALPLAKLRSTSGLRAVREKSILGASMKRLVLLFAVSLSVHAAPPQQRQWQIADEPLRNYFQRETRELAEKCLTDVATRADWEKRAPEMRA